MRWAALVLLALCACASPVPPAPFAAYDKVRTDSEDTLLDLAREHGLGYGEIVAANPGVDPWMPGVGNDVILPSIHIAPPAPPEGLVINIAEQRLYLFDHGDTPLSYPIGIGRPGWRTPLGTTRVERKREAPIWYPTQSAHREDPTLPQAVGPGPDNPLGTHAIYLGWPRFLIHGTNEPYGVGRRVSRGCIRLYPEDIVHLFARVAVGTPVRVINSPIKTGWIDGELYLEAHPPLDQDSEHVPAVAQTLTEELADQLRRTAGDVAGRLDWEAVERALRERRGVPMRVTRSPEEPPTFADRLRTLVAGPPLP